MYYLYNKNNLFKGSLNLVISKAVGEAAFNVSFLTPKSSTSPARPPKSLFASPVPEAVECNNERHGLGLAATQTWVGILTPPLCPWAGCLISLEGPQFPQW